jgi:hypothetical protein
VPHQAELQFERETTAGIKNGPATIDALIIAGWTGRDVAALEAHIKELEALGVQRPKSTPIFYRVAAALLTNADEIQVMGNESSGEIEPVVFSLDDGLWVGVGSDHTDRKAETMGVTLSKQMCAKPVSRRLWPYEEVADHWDKLILRSYAHKAEGRKLYQEGPVSTMRPPTELMRRYMGKDGRLPPGSAMFGGTLAVHGGIAVATAFEMELEDPVLKRKITHRYAIKSLPVEG